MLRSLGLTSQEDVASPKMLSDTIAARSMVLHPELEWRIGIDLSFSNRKLLYD